MMISSESEEEYTPKRPKENSDKKKTDTKKSVQPIKKENAENKSDFGSDTSSVSPLKQVDKEKAWTTGHTSTFTTPSSESDSSSESSSDSSSSSDQTLDESPETKRIRQAKIKAQKKAKKRAKRNEQTA